MIHEFRGEEITTRLIYQHKLPDALTSKHAKTKNKFVKCITPPQKLV